MTVTFTACWFVWQNYVVRRWTWWLWSTSLTTGRVSFRSWLMVWARSWCVCSSVLTWHTSPSCRTPTTQLFTLTSSATSRQDRCRAQSDRYDRTTQAQLQTGSVTLAPASLLIFVFWLDTYFMWTVARQRIAMASVLVVVYWCIVAMQARLADEAFKWNS